jgi:phosphatidylserine decarboxylase
MKSLLDDLYINMTVRPASARTLLWEDISFLLSNRIPRQLANRFFGWFSQIEAPLLARASIAIWRLFADLDLSESQTQRFTSLHARAETRCASGRPRPADSHQPL